MKTILIIVILSLVAAVTVVMFNQPKSQSKIYNTPDGTVTAKTKNVDSFPQKIVLASNEQCIKFNDHALEAKNFVLNYLPKVTTPTLKDFDDAFEIWQKTNDERYTKQQVIEMLGAYLGNQLIKEQQMEWVVVTDKYGTDFAVRGKKYEVISFPFSSVEKRINNNEYDFMVGVYFVVKEMIENSDFKER